MHRFDLPPAIADLVGARNRPREHYKNVGLTFTLDGNLVGDLGEAITAELFGVKLVDARSTAGIDGYAPDGRTVQVKATGVNGGPAFRLTETRADHLLFFNLDFEGAVGTVIFNGPEHIATATLPARWLGQKAVSPFQIRAADARVAPADRLQTTERPRSDEPISIPEATVLASTTRKR